VAQKAREAAAIGQIQRELPVLPWLPDTEIAYERQDTPEARFVHAVDKLCPKISLRVTGELSARLLEMGPERVAAFRDAEAADMNRYAADFPQILALRDQLNTVLASSFLT